MGLLEAGKIVGSLKRIFEVSHTTRASSFEKAGERNPTFASAGNPEMAAKAAKERAGFLVAYREAFRAMKNAVRDVFFPAGTWRLARELGVNVISIT